MFFRNEIQPFAVVLMIDSSFSMRDSLTLVKSAAEQFISRMGPEDTGQVGSFNDKITFGGSFFFELKKTADLAATFARVAQELRSPYTLGFTPANLDGKRHKLEIRVKSGTTVRARRGYLATREGLSGAN